MTEEQTNYTGVQIEEDSDEYLEEDEDVEEQAEYANDKIDALIRLLIKKNLISEDEIEKEYEEIFNEEHAEDSEENYEEDFEKEESEDNLQELNQHF